MNPQSKKKLQNFKKEIKKEAVDRKKFQIRRQLPYYEEMFRQIDESSNATNSRSSRFPIRVCPSKQRSTVFGQHRTHSEIYPPVGNKNNRSQEEEQQTRYLQYLKSMNSVFSEQDKALVENQMTVRYGQNCFTDIQKLRQLICCDLLIYQKLLYSDQERMNEMEKITLEDWNFVIASLKFAQNERFEQIKRTSFAVITGLFNQWYYQQLMQLISKNHHSTIYTIFANMNHLQAIQIQIQQPILSTLLTYNISNSQQTLHMITQYMIDKMKIFEQIQIQMLELFDVEETQNFSQMVFNFGFAHGVVLLVQTLDRVDADFQLRMKIYSLVGKYYAMYPININSETQTEQKFNTFIIDYLNNLKTFCLQITQTTTRLTINPNNKLFQFMLNTQSLIHSMLWKDYLDENTNYEILSIYSHLIIISLNIDGLIARLNEFNDFHRRMIEFSLTFYSFFQGSRLFFIRDEYVQYVSLLIMYLHEIKLKVKHQSHTLLQTQDICAVNNTLKQQLSNLECNLIYALYLINDSQTNEECQKICHDVAKLLQYTEFVYRSQERTLEEIRSFQNLQNINLIFEDNVKLYFRVFFNQSQKHISNSNTDKHYQSKHFSGEVQI